MIFRGDLRNLHGLASAGVNIRYQSRQSNAGRFVRWVFLGTRFVLAAIQWNHLHAPQFWFCERLGIPSPTDFSPQG
jgi:hypothetical protein